MLFLSPIMLLIAKSGPLWSAAAGPRFVSARAGSDCKEVILRAGMTPERANSDPKPPRRILGPRNSALVTTFELTPYAGYRYQPPPAKSFLMLPISKTLCLGQKCPSNTSTLSRKSTYQKIRPSKTSLFQRFFVTFSSQCSTLLHPQRLLSDYTFCILLFHYLLFAGSLTTLPCHSIPFIFRSLHCHVLPSLLFSVLSTITQGGGYPPSFSIQPSSFQSLTTNTTPAKALFCATFHRKTVTSVAPWRAVPVLLLSPAADPQYPQRSFGWTHSTEFSKLC